MKQVLVVVDMQNDFITGALGTAEARAVVPAVAEAIRGWTGDICVTRDTHGPDYPDTQEGRKLPVPHCMAGTAGWAVEDAVAAALAEKAAAGTRVTYFDKPTFGSRALAEALAGMDPPPEAVELMGLCTDICVISNAMLLRAFLPDTPIRVAAACCAGVTPESHQNALAAMAACQIEII